MVGKVSGKRLGTQSLSLLFSVFVLAFCVRVFSVALASLKRTSVFCPQLPSAGITNRSYHLPPLLSCRLPLFSHVSYRFSNARSTAPPSSSWGGTLFFLIFRALGSTSCRLTLPPQCRSRVPPLLDTTCLVFQVVLRSRPLIYSTAPEPPALL